MYQEIFDALGGNNALTGIFALGGIERLTSI